MVWLILLPFKSPAKIAPNIIWFYKKDLHIAKHTEWLNTVQGRRLIRNKVTFPQVVGSFSLEYLMSQPSCNEILVRMTEIYGLLSTRVSTEPILHLIVYGLCSSFLPSRLRKGTRMSQTYLQSEKLSYVPTGNFSSTFLSMSSK